MKSEVDVLEKKLDKLSKALQKLKAANNSIEKVMNESEELLRTTKKNDEDKKYTSADELIKQLNARAEDNRKINEVLTEYNAKEAQRASEEVEKFNKIINDNPDMSSEKSEIINRLIELYNLKKLCYLNNEDNNSKANEKIDNVSIGREKSELERRLRDLPKKGSGVFTSQKEFAKLLTFLAQLHARNNSKKLKVNINQLLKALYNSKQISELVYKNLIAAI